MADRPAFLSTTLKNRVVRSCASALPVESCGLIAGREGRGRKLYRCSNVDGDEHSYGITADEVYRASLDADKYGWMLLGSWHSHPTGPDELSAEDVAGSPEIAGWVHVLVAFLAGAPTVRGFVLRGDLPAREVHL